MKIQVNKKAPAYHEEEILIYAPAEKIYDILSGINDWPRWQGNVSEAYVHGSVMPGKKFVWKAGGFKIKSEIHTANSPTELGWTGKIFWIKAVHNWSLLPDGKATRVKVEESLEGFLAGTMRKTLADGIEKSLIELKIESEKETY